jgi:hypothetical protein
MSPRVQETIKKQVEERLANALNERKKMFEEEIEKEKAHAKEMEEAFQRALEERQKAIQEEIEQEKKRMMGGVVVERAATSPRFPMTKRRVSHFEDRLQFKHNPLFTEKLPPPMKLAPEIPSVQEMEEPVKNIVIHIPKSSETEEKTLQSTPSFDQLSDV